jgi:hypothetical protein
MQKTKYFFIKHECLKRVVILFFFSLLVVGCDTSLKYPIVENDLKHKTFRVIFQETPDTLNLVFKDSTHVIYDNSYYGEIPWQLKNYKGGQFLILENRVFGIEALGNGEYICNVLATDEQSFKMQERQTKWNKDSLYGKWMPIKDYNTMKWVRKNPKANQLPPPYSPPEGYTKADFKKFSYYDITKDSINLYKFYRTENSALDINNTNEFLMMQLNNSIDDELNSRWEIKELVEKYMVVERLFQDTETMDKTKVIDTLVRL